MGVPTLRTPGGFIVAADGADDPELDLQLLPMALLDVAERIRECFSHWGEGIPLVVRDRAAEHVDLAAGAPHTSDQRGQLFGTVPRNCRATPHAPWGAAVAEAGDRRVLAHDPHHGDRRILTAERGID